MDKTKKLFYLSQATNASFVSSPSGDPSYTPEPLEPEPEESMGLAGNHPCPCCGCSTFPAPKEEAIVYVYPMYSWGNDVFNPDEGAPSDENRGITLRQGRENYWKRGAVWEDLVRHAQSPRPGEQPL